ncbi:hypothetical protein HY605_03560 [Candidatus Peregrinibacteria bacterium]|nr:hypothetical protein [Candidatus Peregrinibacteria bacterium]
MKKSAKTKTKTKIKIIVQFIIVMALSLLTLSLTALAKESLPIPHGAETIYTENLVTPPKGETGQTTARNLILSGLEYVKILIAVVGIVYISIMGYTMVTQGENEEEVTKAKRGLIYTLIAFLLISMSEDLGRIFDMDQGTILENPQEVIKRAHLFDKEVEIIVTFIKYCLAAFATLMVVRSGFKLITAGGNEEETSKHKKSIMYSAGGLVLVYLGDIFINKVFYKVNQNVYSGITGVHPKVDAKEGVAQIIGATNFVVSFVGPLAVLMLLIGAIMYATAGGEEEALNKAKRVLLTVGIGIILIFGAFAIVSTVVSGRLEDLNAIA